MARVRGRTDANQKKIVDHGRSKGASVAIISNSGDGITDTIFGFCGVTVLVEIKDGSKPPSKRRLTKDQKSFHNDWKGAITVVENTEQVDILLEKMSFVGENLQAGILGFTTFNCGAYCMNKNN